MSVRRPRPDVCQGGRLDQNLKNAPESRDGDVKFSVAAHADGARPFDRSTVMAPSRVSRAGHDASGARRRRRASPTERPVTPTHPGEAKLLVEEYDGTELDYVFLGHPRDAFDDTLSSVERVGVRPRRRAGLGSVARALRAAFLPEGYPDSVTPDYAPFQFWDTCQALCSYVRGSLTTRALLDDAADAFVGGGDGLLVVILLACEERVERVARDLGGSGDLAHLRFVEALGGEDARGGGQHVGATALDVFATSPFARRRAMSGG